MYDSHYHDCHEHFNIFVKMILTKKLWSVKPKISLCALLSSNTKDLYENRSLCFHTSVSTFIFIVRMILKTKINFHFLWRSTKFIFCSLRIVTKLTPFGTLFKKHNTINQLKILLFMFVPQKQNLLRIWYFSYDLFHICTVKTRVILNFKMDLLAQKYF